MYLCKGYDSGEKVDLSKGYWNPKRKVWVTTLFFRDNYKLSNHNSKKALKYKEYKAISSQVSNYL